MKELLLDRLSMAYGIAGIICCIAYIPTVRDLYLNKKSTVNTTTYWLWTISAFVSLLYSLFILQDLIFAVVSLLNLVFCALILYLGCRLPKRKIDKIV